MKKQKSGFLQRMMAVLLAAVLVAGMAWDGTLTSVLAQESVSENTPAPAEGETEPAGEDIEPAEKTDSEGQEPDGGLGQATPQPDGGTGELLRRRN